MGVAGRAHLAVAQLSGLADRLSRVDGGQPPGWLPDDAVIVRQLADRDPWLRYRKPRYQLQMIKDLASLLPPGGCRVLDVGAGSGLIGETIATLFPEKSVTGVDIATNNRHDLRIPFVRFDGRRLPFADKSFDCVLFCNVLHHVRPEVRTGLLGEALRVTGGGPLVIKDHLASAPLDGLRLRFLDFLGNAPRGSMISADYLGEMEWEMLLREVNCTGETLPVSAYHADLWNWCFPNRLEICFRVRRQSSEFG
ncbi:MAG: class I SAM-dependent methyltransferase [Rhodospirillales bacterium]|nr:MAG: class I SAM-dependent methyltransferase [Rhodospirillales bacterium]